ncbi:hypothetical protein AVEN_23017-1 [Araneus ventricosus]|uniref:Uncharacterized protein n=1 Tax=Araneus ventricosus TaxID=182803 RepID=A0A4Y2LPB6_ARAVE|nr:hypothetical protein AVEN_23017-1 [Araneus ventricosus]
MRLTMHTKVGVLFHHRVFPTCRVHSKRRIRRNPQRKHRPGTIRLCCKLQMKKGAASMHFVDIDNDIAICSKATVKALTSESLEFEFGFVAQEP